MMRSRNELVEITCDCRECRVTVRRSRPADAVEAWKSLNGSIGRNQHFCDYHGSIPPMDWIPEATDLYSGFDAWDCA